MSITLRIIWRTQKDSEVCPVCKALEGYTWIVQAGERFPKQLIHHEHGPVYDMRPAVEGSLIKEKTGHICRCKLLHQYDVTNMLTNHGGESKNTDDKEPDKGTLIPQTLF